jgi:hypothetical protein
MQPAHHLAGAADNTAKRSKRSWNLNDHSLTGFHFHQPEASIPGQVQLSHLSMTL